MSCYKAKANLNLEIRGIHSEVWGEIKTLEWSSSYFVLGAIAGVNHEGHKKLFLRISVLRDVQILINCVFQEVILN